MILSLVLNLGSMNEKYLLLLWLSCTTKTQPSKAREIHCSKTHAVRTATRHHNQDFNNMETPSSVVSITNHLHYIKI